MKYGHVKASSRIDGIFVLGLSRVHHLVTQTGQTPRK